MRLLIAINEDKGNMSQLSSHFGHCPFFALYETETKELKIVKNELDHADQMMSPVDQIMRFKPDMVFSLGIGQRAITLFDEKGVKLKKGDYHTVEEVIQNIDNLEELTSGCGH